MADARVWLIPAQGARTLAPPSSSIPGLIRTDDRGYYRIPGVLAGVYHVAAQLIVLPQPIMPRQGSFSWTPPSVEPTTLVDVPAGTEVEGIDALGIVSEYSSRPLQVPGR